MRQVKFGVRNRLLLILMVMSQLLLAQADTSTWTREFAVPYRSARAFKDMLDNWYLIDDAGKLQKYNRTGKLIGYYHNTRFGKPSSVDATNPFSVFCFYQKQQRVVILDNAMTEVLVLNLQDFGYYDVKAIGRSNDNQLWLYDAVQYKLVKLSTAGQVLNESIPVEPYLSETLVPNYLVEHENKVFLGINQYGFLIFDNFGKFLKNIRIDGASDFVLEGDFFRYALADEMYLMDPLYFESKLLKGAAIQKDLLHFYKEVLLLLPNETVIYQRN